MDCLSYNLSAFPTRMILVLRILHLQARSKDWPGEDIACDVSRYIDGLDASKTYLCA